MATATQFANVFEERAENLSESELKSWTVLSDVEKQTVKKIIGPGAKLVSGPRGSGKSTLLKFAFFELLKTRAALPVYVNFSKALALEPLFHTHANAIQWFRQWVLAKLLVGVNETCEKWNTVVPSGAHDLVTTARTFIAELEAGNTPSQGLRLTPSGLSETIREIANHCAVTRTVLLLDDAAHAFSVQQQREFFEVFRELRSRDIAAKAAIYPGVTSFSPSFQVGHEAEVVQAWIRADSASYLPSLRQIAAKRFPDLNTKLGASYQESIDVLALASFGLPRGFVNMISEVVDAVDLDVPTRKAVTDAIGSNSDGVATLFENIADKLPRFTNYVELGSKLEREGSKAIREFNRGKGAGGKTATLGLAEPWDAELDRVLRFMEYAGLLRKIEPLSKGVKGSYQRYVLHYSRVIANNLLFLGKSYKLVDIVSALQKPAAHALVKTKPTTLLGMNFAEKCTLALPPCPACHKPRISEDQKFCMNCGKELRSASVYLELLKASVDKLPLPERKKEALKEANLATVGQLLSDESQRFRKPGSSIGPVWARRILTVAEEFVSV